jgi:hypothetical protein
MEIWLILLICLLMFPAFYLANYIIVKKLVRQKKHRDELMERAVAVSVARRMRSKDEKYSPKPRFGSRRRR